MTLTNGELITSSNPSYVITSGSQSQPYKYQLWTLDYPDVLFADTTDSWVNNTSVLPTATSGQTYTFRSLTPGYYGTFSTPGSNVSGSYYYSQANYIPVMSIGVSQIATSFDLVVCGQASSATNTNVYFLLDSNGTTGIGIHDNAANIYYNNLAKTFYGGVSNDFFCVRIKGVLSGSNFNIYGGCVLASQGLAYMTLPSLSFLATISSFLFNPFIGGYGGAVLRGFANTTAVVPNIVQMIPFQLNIAQLVNLEGYASGKYLSRDALASSSRTHYVMKNKLIVPDHFSFVARSEQSAHTEAKIPVKAKEQFNVKALNQVRVSGKTNLSETFRVFLAHFVHGRSEFSSRVSVASRTELSFISRFAHTITQHASFAMKTRTAAIARGIEKVRLTLFPQTHGTMKLRTPLGGESRAKWDNRQLLGSQHHYSFKVRYPLAVLAEAIERVRTTIMSEYISKFLVRVTVSLKAQSKNLVRTATTFLIRARSVTALKLSGIARSIEKVRSKQSFTNRATANTKLPLKMETRSTFRGYLQMVLRGHTDFVSRAIIKALTREPYSIKYLYIPAAASFIRPAAKPFSTATVQAIVTDVNSERVLNLTSVVVSLSFPDGSTGTVQGALNVGAGTYQIEYTTKGPGAIKETWQLTDSQGNTLIKRTNRYVSW